MDIFLFLVFEIFYSIFMFCYFFFVCYFDFEDLVGDFKFLEVGLVMGWKNFRFLNDFME